MSALPRPDALALRPFTFASLDQVVAIERTAYEFPWTRVNFIDSMAAHYVCEALVDAGGAVRGYFIAMGGVEEMHLLNLTVAPAWQRRGLARRMLGALVERCVDRGDERLWLEVRVGNRRARAIYERYGFREVGIRKRYYPAHHGGREDALVMSLPIEAGRSDAVV